MLHLSFKSIGKALAQTGLIVGVVLSVQQFIRGCKESEPRLTASVLTVDYIGAPDVFDLVERVRDKVRGTNFWSVISPVLNDSNATLKAVSAVNSQFNDISLWVRDPKIVHHITIENVGELPCTQVAIRIPHVLMISVTRNSSRESSYSLSVKEHIELGQIRPGETIKLSAWSDYAYWGDEIQLTHEKGRGKVYILEPVGNPWRTLSRMWALAAFPIITLFVTALCVVYIKRRSSLNAAQPARSQKNVEERHERRAPVENETSVD